MKVEIEFRDWVCLVCGVELETAPEMRRHTKAEHLEFIQVWFLPFWLLEPLLFLGVLTGTGPVRLAGRVWWRLRHYGQGLED